MKNILIYGLTALAIGCVSCNDFLTEEPVVKLKTETMLSNYDGLRKATQGAYTYLYDGTWYGSEFVLSCELRSGNAKNPTNTNFTSGRLTKEYSWNYVPSSTSNLWNYAYYTIAAANNVLNNADGKESTDVTTQDLNDLKAECLFLRALSYFDLVRTYSQPYTSDPNSLGVPLVFVTENGLPARNTVKEVYDQVEKDLLNAETLITSGRYNRSEITDSFAVASKPAIQALLSRVYLYMGEWQKSADYATKVINDYHFTLYTKEEFTKFWGREVAEDGKEVIFEVYGSLNNEYNEYWEEISWMTNPDGYADAASSADLRDLYEPGDVRGTLFKNHENAKDHYWTTKYPGKNNNRPTANNIIVLRLAEMYLNRAEAIVRGATVAGVTAASDLLQITSNRGASTVPATLENILLERRKELAFEGHLIYDMARTGTALHRVDYQGSATAKDIPFPDYRWALPIPKREMDANPNMVQNPEY